MALNLIEKVAGATGPQAMTAGGRKRSWSSSNWDEQSPATSNKHGKGDRFAGRGGGGSGAEIAASAGSTMMATECTAATPAVQLAAARTGKREAATPDTANMVAEGCRTMVAAEEPVAVAAAAAAVAPGATSAEEAAVQATTVPAEAGTATRRSAQLCKSHTLRHGSTVFNNLFAA